MSSNPAAAQGPPPIAPGLSETTGPRPRRRSKERVGAGTLLGLGVSVLYLSLIVLIPLAALTTQAFDGGWQEFWDQITSPQAVAALKLTFVLSAAAVIVNGVMGTITAWVLIRDDFRGKALLDVLIDLPFAIPTIVAGLTLLALYGQNGPLGVNVAFTTTGIVLALVFVTLPFTVRAVQPVLLELDREMEEAAASLGAGRARIFFRVVLPNLVPAMVSGIGLAFAKALGEFGSVVLIAGNIPFKTELASVYIFGQIESDNPQGAAAVSVVLLIASLLVLVALNVIERRLTRHAR